MLTRQFLETSLLILLFMPLAISLSIGLSLLLRLRVPERWIQRVSAFSFTLSIAIVVLMFYWMELYGKPAYWSYGLFKTYRIDVVLMVDRLSLLYLLVSTLLIGIIGRFAFSYLHKEEGFHRFFVLLHLAAFGLQLAVSSGCIDLLWVGWECLGISSVLLVAFFHERKGPVDNGLYIFFIYRLGDLALLTVGLWLHTSLGTTHYQHILAPEQLAKLQAGGLFSTAFFLGLLVVLAAIVKGGLFPFINWLPRAMEGPTPSSAVFYGALSTHLGIFLLIRTYPLLQATAWVLPLLILIGIISVILGTAFGQIQTDAKNALADATIVQLGLMLIEIGLGWTTLATVHLFSHAILRSYQFLKVPSILHTHHEMMSFYGEKFGTPRSFIWRILPQRLQYFLYGVALERAFLEATMERLFVLPTMKFSRWLNQKEDILTRLFLTEPTAQTSLIQPTASPPSTPTASTESKAPVTTETPAASSETTPSTESTASSTPTASASSTESTAPSTTEAPVSSEAAKSSDAPVSSETAKSSDAPTMQDENKGVAPIPALPKGESA